jgi:hypothetical protein
MANWYPNWGFTIGTNRVISSTGAYIPAHHQTYFSDSVLNTETRHQEYPPTGGSSFYWQYGSGGIDIDKASGLAVIGGPGNSSGTVYSKVTVIDLYGNLYANGNSRDVHNRHFCNLPSGEEGTTIEFGKSVAIGDGVILVGAPMYTGTETQDGAVFVYDYMGNYIRKMTPPTPAEKGKYGQTVAVGHGRIAIAEVDDNVFRSTRPPGKVHLYKTDGTFIKTINNPDGADNSNNYDDFGISMDIGLGRIVIGAPQFDIDSTSKGKVYVFDVTDGIHLKTIKDNYANSSAANKVFGYSVSIGCGRIVVGDYDTEMYDVHGISTLGGIAHVYDLQYNYITSLNQLLHYNHQTNSGSYFGWSVSIGSGFILVGNKSHKSPANDANAKTSAFGAATLFDLNGNELFTFYASDRGDYDYDTYGEKVAIGCGKVFIASPDSGGDNDPTGEDRIGAVYIYDIPEDTDGIIETIAAAYKYR